MSELRSSENPPNNAPRRRRARGRANGRGEPGASVTPPLAPLTRRSGVTTGKRLFMALRDRNSVWSRRLADLIALHVSDLGGSDAISEAEKVLVRRAAMLSLQLEMMEQKWAANGGAASAKELALYARATGNLRRVLRDLGLQRRQKD